MTNTIILLPDRGDMVAAGLGGGVLYLVPGNADMEPRITEISVQVNNNNNKFTEIRTCIHLHTKYTYPLQKKIDLTIHTCAKLIYDVMSNRLVKKILRIS